jgi:hypothetical protein
MANVANDSSGSESQLNAELELWKKQREETSRRLAEDRRQAPQFSTSRRDEALSAARAAANTNILSSVMSSPHSRDISSFPAPGFLTETLPSSSAASSVIVPIMPNPVSTSFSHGGPAMKAPTAVRSRPPSFIDPRAMPLESPSRYEGDSTDSETTSLAFTDRFRERQAQHHDISPAKR